MRPLDLLPGHPHAFYDQTYDNLTGARLLVLADYSAKSIITNASYTFLRNGTTWAPLPGGARPPIPAVLPAMPAGATPHLFAAHPTAARALGIVNRNNTGNIVLNPEFLVIQKPAQTRQVRVGLPPDEAGDLVSAWNDGNWNGAAPAAIPTAVKTYVTDALEATTTVPGVAASPGTFYGYRGAIRDLERGMGGYCAYCESKRQDGRTLDVEHRVAKQSYHSELLRWDNYLIGCQVCNSSFKRIFPNRDNGITNAITAFHAGAGIVYAGGPISPVIPGGGGGRIPYWQMREACDLNYLWPSLDDGGTPNAPIGANAANPTNYSLLCMRYQLREYNAAGAPVAWVPVADAINLANTVVDDGPHGTVLANIWDSTLPVPALRQMYLRVEAVPSSPATGAAAFDARKLQAAANTEAMAGLNARANAYGDRRQMQRTHAWLQALEFLRLLRDQLTALNRWTNSWVWRRLWGPPPVAFTNDQWSLVASAAEAGYYSVWLTVFKQFSQANLNNGNLAVQLAQELQNRAAGNSPYHYWGTNLANSVTAQIPNL